MFSSLQCQCRLHLYCPSVARWPLSRLPSDCPVHFDSKFCHFGRHGSALYWFCLTVYILCMQRFCMHHSLRPRPSRYEQQYDNDWHLVDMLSNIHVSQWLCCTMSCTLSMSGQSHTASMRCLWLWVQAQLDHIAIRCHINVYRDFLGSLCKSASSLWKMVLMRHTGQLRSAASKEMSEIVSFIHFFIILYYKSADSCNSMLNKLMAANSYCCTKAVRSSGVAAADCSSKVAQVYISAFQSCWGHHACAKCTDWY